jgi:hypothetical protein
MIKYRVRVWCEACWGDAEGCFGGISELMPSRFETVEEAEATALEYCGSLPYGYRVEEASEQDVDPAPVPVDAPSIASTDLPIQ